jgi:hypothetical protein
MNTAERRVQLLSLITAILPAVVEQLVQPEKPKPKVEHKVVAYSFSYSVGDNQSPLPFDVTPPEGDDWQLAQLDLPSGMAHWTRVVMVESERSDTISSPPPDMSERQGDPFTPAQSEAVEAPMVPCDSCHQFPHSSTCPGK